MDQTRIPHILILMFNTITNWIRRQWNRDILKLYGPYEADCAHELGRGAYGVVWVGRNVQTNDKVAIKCVKASTLTEKFIERELQLLSKCDHKHIIKLLHSEKGNDSNYFVFEYCIHGNLNSFIKDREISPGLCLKFMLNIGQAVDYLHKKSISHRDIKPTNILVSEHDGYFLKLADFGLARYFPESSTGIPASLNTGTLCWMAPEVHDNSGLGTRYNKSADVFSLGLLFLALVRHQFGRFLEPFTVHGTYIGHWMRFQYNEGRDVPVPDIGDRADKRIDLIHHMLVFRHDQRYRMPDVCKKLSELPRTEERVTRCASTAQPKAPSKLASCIRTPARTRTCAVVCVSVFVLLLALAAGIYLTGDQARYERCEDIWSRLDINSLERTLKENLYGQHLAVEAIVHSFREHTKHPRPEKALMLSMHGPPGVGKSYARRLIAQHLYEGGYGSPYVQVVKTAEDHKLFQPDNFQSNTIIKWVQSKIRVCLYTLFVFDKAEYLPSTLLKDMNHALGSDISRSIFLFESQYALSVIRNQTFQHYETGGKREDINLKLITDVIKTKEETNSVRKAWQRNFLRENIISAVVPFLPLERKHLVRCIEDVVESDEDLPASKWQTRSSIIKFVAAKYQFIEVKSTLFSVTGCRHIREKMMIDSH